MPGGFVDATATAASGVEKPPVATHKPGGKTLKCIFCGAQLSALTAPEHILLASLGGRMTTRISDCDACNHKFGETIDNAIALQTIELRNLLQLKSGSGDDPPTLSRIRAADGVYKLNGDGTPAFIGRPFTLEKLENGSFNLQIFAQSEKEIKKYIPDIARALKISEDLLRSQLPNAEVSEVYRRPGQVTFNLALGGLHPIRSMVKSSLCLWTETFGNEEGNNSAFDATKAFVMSGDETLIGQFAQLDSRDLPIAASLEDKFGSLFNLIYLASDDVGRLLGYFVLYNTYAWQLNLTSGGAIPNQRAVLVLNPLDPAKWSSKVRDVPQLEFDWLTMPHWAESDQPIIARRLGRIMEIYQERSFSREAKKIIELVLRVHGIDPYASFDGDIPDQVCSEIAMRLVHHRLNLPVTRKWTADDLRKFLSYDQPNQR